MDDQPFYERPGNQNPLKDGKHRNKRHMWQLDIPNERLEMPLQTRVTNPA